MPTLEEWTARGEGYLPGHLGFEILEIDSKSVVARMKINTHHLAPNSYLHAGSIITLADTACGYGCIASLPEGASSFTTIELKANFLGTTRSGAIRCEATLTHGGRTTQVWDARVLDEANNKLIALFRCTQLLLYKTGDR